MILSKQQFQKLGLSFLMVFCSQLIYGQTVKAKFGKGVYFIAKDSSMDVKLTFRFQTLFSAEQTLNVQNQLQDDFKSNFLIRRSRIKLDGFVYNPKLVYKVELAISNRDMGLSKGEESYFSTASNLVLDAVLKWRFAKNTELWVGQTKLPGNRERVISSQKLQFVDRSLLNNQFNLDRDVGLQLKHVTHFGEKFLTKETACITLGEGRNVTAPNDDGFCYTGRVEAYPFGEFEGEGDYVGSDVEREKKPKLAIGITYDYNDGAGRTAGQLGSFIRYDSLKKDIQSLHADFMYKHLGFSMMGEYAKRFVAEGNPGTYYVGSAYNIQSGFLFKNNIELAGRYTQLRPDKWSASSKEIIDGTKVSQFTFGVSKYIVKHNLKIQSDISTSIHDNDNRNYLMYRFQVEMQF